MTYLPHVDGLRAVAVLGVLLAHFGLPGFPGGFLGVDVFFVISGYLITGLILNERARSGGFSFRRFYLRRLRRLMPAALATILVTLLVLTPVLGPEDRRSFLRSVPAAILSLANVNFYLEIGYFDTAARFKPLLHTWSLAVEEQFYLIWPALLLALARLRRGLLPAVLALAALSLGAAEIWQGRDAAAAYYLLPFRAFELLIGAALAIALPRPAAPGRPAGAALAGLGLALVLGSFALLDRDSPLPGLPSLLPCLGTALLIGFGAGGPVGRLLSSGPAVWLGRISYSLYLVHWPLAVYVAYRLPEAPSPALRLALIPLAIGLAAASYYLVEQPLRHPAPAGRSNAPVLAGMALVAAALCLPTAWTRLQPGPVPLRLAAEAGSGEVRQRSLPYPGSPDGARIQRLSPAGAAAPVRVLILGDSHAGHLAAGARLLAARGLEVDLATLAGCPPLFGVTRAYAGAKRAGREAGCRRHTAAKQALALSPRYDAVILAARWYAMVEPSPATVAIQEDGLIDAAEPGMPGRAQSRALFETSLAQTLAALRAAGKRVVVVSQVPELGNDLSQCQSLFPWARAAAGSRCYRLGRAEIAARGRYADGVIARAAAAAGALAVLPEALFCPDAACLLHDPQTGEALYQDSHHLSAAGALFLIEAAEARHGLTGFLGRRDLATAGR